ncbi:hypothetical protein BpHYR1_029692 [Brachionus plicatilis]|uniref:Uncharacterized protein n=1 Tax=Brachionus plicatilis TaxID=10195 RepID=A0A3M7T3T9_BRAPC|nr:hypothetical protein BpHYR1_029692 [Brachionus plicatilis]
MYTKFIFFLCLFDFSRQELTDSCSYNKKIFELKCENFTKFSDLKLEKLNNSIRIKQLFLSPKNQIDFDYQAAFQLDQITSLILNESEITLKNFKSFDTSITEFFIWRSSSVHIDASKIKFLINKQDLNSCDLSLASVAKFFRKFKKIKFGPSVEFLEPFCPILFYRIDLETLEFSNLDRGILSAINFDVSDFMYSQISKLVIKDSRLKNLDSTQLDNRIFGNLQSFSYSSLAEDVNFSIEEQVFSNFSQIQFLEISLQNLADFVYGTNLTWLKNVESQKFELILRDYSKSYSYPDKDFCIFYDSLKDKKFTPIIYTNETIECSCTLVWLVKELVNSKNVHSNGSVENCLENFEEIFEKCSFETKIRECYPESTTTTSTTKTTTLVTSSTAKQTLTNTVPLKKENVWSVIPAVIGIIGILLFVPFIGYYFYYERRKKLRKKYPHEKENVNTF